MKRKRKAREWWIGIDPFGGVPLVSKDRVTAREEMRLCNFVDLKIVHVREVLKRKKAKK